MKSVFSDIATAIVLVLSAVVLFYFVSLIAAILCGVIVWFFSATKCPNCTKSIRTRGIRCPRCGGFLTEEPQEELNPELYARVKTFVAEFWSTSEEKLNPDTLLADDLGIAGDDGYELLEAFCEEFEIQNTCEIEPYEYFGGEGWDPRIFLFFYDMFLFLYNSIFDKEKRNDSDFEPPLSLRDLVKSAEAKRWIPPAVR